MIDLNAYDLAPSERSAVAAMLAKVGPDPTLEEIWRLMDEAWEAVGVDGMAPAPDQLAAFYRHPVWLLNGMFIEQHDISMGHRRAITHAVQRLDPRAVVDFGGGFGTLARLLAVAMPSVTVTVCDPFPPRHGVTACAGFANITFATRLIATSCDVLVCTDVLEHVEDPILVLHEMIQAVRPGGHLLIANCFFPVIACHLPRNLHFRFTFDDICRACGLEVIGPCAGSHATLYRRVETRVPDWKRLRRLEERSQRWYPFRVRRAELIARAGARVRGLLDRTIGPSR